MPGAFENYVEITDLDGTFSQSVTVPAATTAVALFIGGWDSTSTGFSSAPTLGGVGFSGTLSGGDTSATQHGYGRYQGGPSTGSQTFAATMSGGAWDEGGFAILVFCSGTETASPVRSEALVATANSFPGTQNLTSLTPDDICIVAGCHFGDPSPTMTNQGQTQIFQRTSLFNADKSGAAYKVADAATETMQYGSNDTIYNAIYYVAFKAAAGGAPFVSNLMLMGVGK